MQRRFLSANSSRWLISFVLLALGVRALVPVGFMPAMDRPFSFQICPDGFPTQLLAPMAGHAAHHHSAGSEHGAQFAGTAAEHAGHHHTAGADRSTPDSNSDPQHDSTSRAEHCVFAAVAVAGPAAFESYVVVLADTHATPDFVSLTPAWSTKVFRVQQPRAPPVFA